jgi:hypothetical protein
LGFCCASFFDHAAKINQYQYAWSQNVVSIGQHAHILSHLRVNTALIELPKRVKAQLGRPKKYGRKLGCTATLAKRSKRYAKSYSINLYGKQREVLAYDKIVMLKTLNIQCGSFGFIGKLSGSRSLQQTSIFLSNRSLSIMALAGKSSRASRKSSGKSAVQKARPGTLMR